MNLYELNQSFNNLIEVLENTEDENIKELIKKSMDQLTLETNEKIENIIKYIKNLEAEAEALEKESKRLNDRKVKTVKSFKFAGKERKQALNKANELMKEYNTKDLRKNF